MRVLFCGGGTGGHVYPALAVASALGDRITVGDALYVGAKGEIEETVVPRENIRLETIEGGGLHGVGPVRFLRNCARLVRGFFQAWRIMGRFQPDVVFSTGGYASVPVAVVAWIRRWPVLVFLPDVEPGWAIKFLSRLATRVAVSVEASQQYLPVKVDVTGYPVRSDFFRVDRFDKAVARKHFDIAQKERVLLVLGGSRGAQSINRALGGGLEKVLQQAHVIHISGALDYDACQTRREALPASARARYHLFAYLHEMAQALAATDLVVARAGAATLGEFPLFGLPSVLVPYPFAWRYQKVNADFLTDRDAAIRLDDEDLCHALWPTIKELFRDDERLKEMSRNSRALARPEATARLAELLTELADTS